MTTRHTTVATVIGAVTLTATDGAITGVYFPHHWYAPSVDTLGEAVELGSDPVLDEAARQLVDYLAGNRDGFDLLTQATGDEFQHQVWALLDEIPYGQTTTYGAIAEKLGDKSLAQRVGQAVGHNPLSVMVPCHRVVGANGRLTGYAGGLGRKQFLLELERPEPVDALF